MILFGLVLIFEMLSEFLLSIFFLLTEINLENEKGSLPSFHLTSDG